MEKSKNRLLLFLSMMLLSYGCQSVATDPWNAQFIGNYATVEVITCYGSLPPCSSTANVVVVVSPGSTDSSVVILGREVVLTQGSDGWSGAAYHYGVTFRNDSVFSFAMNGGLGGGQYQSNIGPKQ